MRTLGWGRAIYPAREARRGIPRFQTCRKDDFLKEIDPARRGNFAMSDLPQRRFA